MWGMSRSIAAREKWSRIIVAQRSSGVSVKRFCEERGIPASSVFAWKRKLADAGEGGPTTTAVFVEAKVGGVDDGRGGGVMIEVVGGRRVLVGRGFDRQLLLEVIEALEPAGGGS